ncbi:hypothetical protein [Paenibacillus sabinae]|uniref:Uncharacterized protein n=1 Tax=Paenibacillus sabinae T27 TaxID=1268072 RepID=X4ZUU1_9BACL|nr:hypothetical protein [Paenibacillus sabinae]AHV95569.1 hypothetical protein PSAB_03165 [Paenibacillus sabinae T27]
MEERRNKAGQPKNSPAAEMSVSQAEMSEDGAASLWECAPGAPEEWLKGWEGRQETHDMFKYSYE